MTISYVLGAEPFWILINLQGTKAGGGKLYTRSSLDFDVEKPVYMDSGGVNAYTNPIIFNLNGVAPGPFYFLEDTDDPDDNYFLQARDADENVLWTIEDYVAASGGGGGSIVTNYIPIVNYIANNQFIDHINDISVADNITNTVIAPSNHKGFTPSILNPLIGINGALGPDIRFIKSATGLLTDIITFETFPMSSAPMAPTDTTPVTYIRYVCGSSPGGEDFKGFQFPITQKVKNLSNQRMTFNIWAKVTALPVTIGVYTRQYFGSGTGATADFKDLQGSILLSTTWTQHQLSFTVPTVAGKSLGTPGSQTDDDALYIILEMPRGAPADVLFTKPALYLGDNINPALDFETYDQINSINSTPRTGDIRVSLSPSAPQGWVPMNDGSIGNAASGATTRANMDTFQLFKTIWDGVMNIWAPTQDSAGVPTARGATALADFLANKRLVLPLSLGRALSGTGTGAGLSARVLGQNTGAETVVLTGANMPTGVPFNPTATSGTSGINAGVALTAPAAASGNPYSAGSSTPVAIMQPTSFMNVFIKL